MCQLKFWFKFSLKLTWSVHVHRVHTQVKTAEHVDVDECGRPCASTSMCPRRSRLNLKLRMFGIPLDKNKPETRILCDDEAVVKNSSNIESTLDEKHSAVACHFTRWNAAAEVCLAGWIPTAQNVADAMTKLLLEQMNVAIVGLHLHWSQSGPILSSEVIHSLTCTASHD